MAAVDLGLLAIEIIIKIIILAPALWLAGKALAGDNAKFLDAIWIIVLGTLIGAIFSYFNIIGIVGLIIQLVIWLALVKHFFDTGWIYAFIISVLAIIILVVIAFLLGLFGLGLGLLLL